MSLLLLALTTSGVVQAQTVSDAAKPKPDEEVHVLSPFNVDASQDHGYYAENTISGTRLRTNVGDLASSITVVTKQQLIDTSSVNINDVFMYEANTEGGNTYTPVVIDRTAAKDTQSGYSAGDGTSYGTANSNRIRGLDVAGTAENNYPTIVRIPFDAYNTQSLEINRGPNSLLFGTGSPAGIVNQSTTEASVNKDSTEVSGRVGSWGAKRESVGHNQVIIPGKVGFYITQLYDDVGFRRQPAYDETRRVYAALTVKPWEKTKITANFENYNNNNRRSNFQTPRDYVTPWLQAGRPAWNPLTQTVTFLDKPGLKFGPYANDTRSTNYVPTYTGPTFYGANVVNAPLVAGSNLLQATTSPWFVPGLVFGYGGSTGRPTMFIDQGNLTNFYEQSPSAVGAPFASTGFPAAPTPAQRAIADNRPTASAAPPIPAGYGVWGFPGVTNRAIYDWTKYNTNQPNFGDQTAKIFNVEIQQEIVTGLNLDLGWFREELRDHDNYSLSQQQAATLTVDTNQFLPDGKVNPYFGSPFVLDTQGDTFVRPEKNNNFRAMLAYELDFTKKANWAKWLGKHRVLGLVSQQDDWTNNLRYRLSFDGGDARYLPNTATNPPGNYSYAGNTPSINRLYYLGMNNGGVVQHSGGQFGSPGYGGPANSSVTTYNYTTQAWEQAPVQMGADLFYAGGNYGVAERIIDAENVAYQGYFWNDRIIPTFGWRKDKYKARATTTAGLTNVDLYTNGHGNDNLWNRVGPWTYLTGVTKTSGIVVKPVVWSSGNISLHYNRSDNFNPPTGTQTDYFGNILPKSTGKGKDYGIGVSLFNNRLVATLNWFQSSNLNAIASAAQTAEGRVTRMDTSNFRSWAIDVVRIRNGEVPSDPSFGNNTTHPLSAAEITQIAALTQFPTANGADPTQWPTTNIQGTQADQAKGLEGSLIYNPTLDWSIKITVGKQKSTYTHVAPELDAWLAYRQPIWNAASATDLAPLYTLSNGTPLSLQHFITGYGFNSDALLTSVGSENPGNFFNSIVQPEINVAKALQGNTVPNERLWSANLVTNYAFSQGALRDLAVGAGVRWASNAIAGFYGDTKNLNSAGLIVASDITRPIYTPAQTHLDLWASYKFRMPWLLGDKIRSKVQLNLRDATEKGRLLAISYNFDGSPSYYRIVDPRQWYLTVTFDF